MILMTFLLRWAPAAAIAFVIFGLSHQSRPPGAGLAPDYVGHFVEYSVFTFAVVWGVSNCLRLISFRRLFVSWLFVAFYAFSDEFHQSFIPGRHPSLSDVIVDIIAATTVVVILGWAASRRKTQEKKLYDWPPRSVRPLDLSE
jgi:VanZ family protein